MVSGVSFVSVTQQFNTTTSMGRLTLNVLLSFAQFEREVTAERIRDKIAASKRKGMWMGGIVPLGYRVENRKLLIDRLKQRPSAICLTAISNCGSVRALSQRRRSADQVSQAKASRRPGNALSAAAIFITCSPTRSISARYGIARMSMMASMSASSIKTPMIALRLCSLPRLRRAAAPTTPVSRHLLTGLVFDEAGERLRSVHANKQGKRYRYYVSRVFSEERRNGRDGWRLPADELESVVEGALIQKLRNAAQLTELTRDVISLPELKRAIAEASDLASKWPLKTSDEKRAVLGDVIHRIELEPASLTMQIAGQRWPG